MLLLYLDHAMYLYFLIIVACRFNCLTVIQTTKNTTLRQVLYRPQSSLVLKTCPTSSRLISQTPTMLSTSSSQSLSWTVLNVPSTSFFQASPSTATMRPPCNNLSHGASTLALLLDPDSTDWQVSTQSSHSAQMAVPCETPRRCLPRYKIWRWKICSDRREAIRLYKLVTVMGGRVERKNVKCEESNAIGASMVGDKAMSSWSASDLELHRNAASVDEQRKRKGCLHTLRNAPSGRFRSPHRPAEQ